MQFVFDRNVIMWLISRVVFDLPFTEQRIELIIYRTNIKRTKKKFGTAIEIL